MTETEEGRDTRQRELVPPARLAKIHAVVVGVGAIGRQVAIQLAAMGVPRVALVDHDRVEAVNLGPQAYHYNDVGRRKVDATFDACKDLNPEIHGWTFGEMFRLSEVDQYLRVVPGTRDWDRVVFSCVDSMETRKFIWESVREKANLWCDCRMGGEVLRVLTSDKPELDDHYETTLFSDAEAYQDSCTARSTIYSASIAAGFAVGQMAKWLRGLPTEKDFILNLLSMDLVVSAG